METSIKLTLQIFASIRLFYLPDFRSASIRFFQPIVSISSIAQPLRPHEFCVSELGHCFQSEDCKFKWKARLTNQTTLKAENRSSSYLSKLFAYRPSVFKFFPTCKPTTRDRRPKIAAQVLWTSFHRTPQSTPLLHSCYLPIACQWSPNDFQRYLPCSLRLIMRFCVPYALRSGFCCFLLSNTTPVKFLLCIFKHIKVTHNDYNSFPLA